MTWDKERGGGDPPEPPEEPDPIVFERRPGEPASDAEGDAPLRGDSEAGDDTPVRIGPPTGL
jgi:hypothetical protein